MQVVGRPGGVGVVGAGPEPGRALEESRALGLGEQAPDASPMTIAGTEMNRPGFSICPECGTIQIDPNLPERLDADFVGEDGSRHRPLMLHRAIVGSLERFIGILIEQHAGALPVWLAPTQVVVSSITDAQADYVTDVVKALQKQGLRVQADLRNEKITYKIREHSLQKVPYILVVGDKEKASGAVAVRARGNQDLGVMSLAEFQEKLANDIATKV